MGHNKSIHLNIYRQLIEKNDILHVSQLLEKAQGIYKHSTGGVQEQVEETDSETENCDQNIDEDNTISVIENDSVNNFTDTGIHFLNFGITFFTIINHLYNIYNNYYCCRALCHASEKNKMGCTLVIIFYLALIQKQEIFKT